MGHHISAIICKPSTDIERLSEFEMATIPVGDFVIIPMDAYHSDDWSERLGLGFGDGRSKVILDGPFAHYVASIAAEGDYALIETDYFGGIGDQVAAVYRKGHDLPLFASERVMQGAINYALRAIGVHARNGADEFDTLGLGRYRNFEERFARYYE